MMADDTPRIAVRLEAARLVLAAFVLFQVLLQWGRHPFLACAYTLIGLVMIAHTVRVLSTKLDAIGVSQWTWRGRAYVRWNDVTAISRHARSVTLTAAGADVIFPISAFYDSTAAGEYLDSHLPPGFRP